MLTIAYITFRKDNHIEWFFESLAREAKGDLTGTRVIVIDYYALEEGRADALKWKLIATGVNNSYLLHYPAKPSVWQGPTRLTSRDYFAAASARNTALCLAPDGWIAYVDDLSILMPGWLAAVQRAMRENYIALGAYKKVKELSLTTDPARANFVPFVPGVDSRWPHGDAIRPVRAAGSWLYGCSVAMPVEALLAVGGWNEDCDSLGSEDYCTGIALEKAGYSFRYDLSMLTLESEEAHHSEPSLPRFDKGTSPRDKSHAILERVMREKRPVAPSHLPGGIRAERARALAGEPFTVPTAPTHDWFDNTPLSTY